MKPFDPEYENAMLKKKNPLIHALNYRALNKYLNNDEIHLELGEPFYDYEEFKEIQALVALIEPLNTSRAYLQSFYEKTGLLITQTISDGKVSQIFDRNGSYVNDIYDEMPSTDNTGVYEDISAKIPFELSDIGIRAEVKNTKEYLQKD